jgi:formylglycine-generating enzyme required for sulfatase activity
MLSMASAREMEEYADPYDLLSDELRGFAGILGECLRPAIDRRIGSVEKILRRLDYLGDSSDAELPKNIPFARSHARMTAAGKYVVVDQPDDPKEKSAGKVIVKAAEVEQRTFPVRMVLPSTPTEKTFDNPNLPKLLLIPGGMHQQGARRGDPDERPPRSVFLNAFYLAETAVTNQAFLQFLLAKGNEKQRYYRENKYGMIQAPSFLRKTYSVKTGFENFPVNNLNWEGAVAYCAWLREESGRPWRLPTEAEWEAAARYKTHPGDQYWWGDDYPLPTHARYGRTWSEEKHNVMIPVDAQAESGRAPCGALNLMGNVWEWCFDFYSRQEYLKGAQANPMGPETGEMRTARGGCWMSQPHELRLTNRRAEPAVAEAALGMGLRMVCDLTEAETELTNLTPEGDVQEPENKAQQAPPVDDDEDDPFAP